MKKVVSLLVTALLLCATFIASAQDNQDKKVSYNMINEYGFYLGGGSQCGVQQTNLGFEGLLINSILFNRTQDLLGIGLGYSVDICAGHGVPMFLNYRHYFDRGKNIKPLVNIAAGATFIFSGNFDYYDDYYNGQYYNGTIYDYPEADKNKTGWGLYATIASGFRYKALSFAAGFYLRSNPINHYVLDATGHYQLERSKAFNGGIQVKLGYTF